MNDEKDIRTLCANCADDMIKGGLKLTRTDNKYRDRCDKCGRMGLDYIIMPQIRENPAEAGL